MDEKNVAADQAVEEFIAGFEEAMLPENEPVVVPETKEQKRNRFVAILAAIWAFCIFVTKLIAGLFVAIWHGICAVWHEIVKDFRYLWDTLMNLNPGMRVGFFLAIVVFAILFTMPAALLGKLIGFAFLLLPVGFFIYLMMELFPILRTTSDANMSMDAAHKEYQHDGDMVGKNMARSVAGVSGNVATATNGGLGTGRTLDAIEG